MNISGIVLYKILEAPDESLQYWSKVKAIYFGAGYAKLYSAIAEYNFA